MGGGREVGSVLRSVFVEPNALEEGVVAIKGKQSGMHSLPPMPHPTRIPHQLINVSPFPLSAFRRMIWELILMSAALSII